MRKVSLVLLGAFLGALVAAVVLAVVMGRRYR